MSDPRFEAAKKKAQNLFASYKLALEQAATNAQIHQVEKQFVEAVTTALHDATTSTGAA